MGVWKEHIIAQDDSYLGSYSRAFWEGMRLMIMTAMEERRAQAARFECL